MNSMIDALTAAGSGQQQENKKRKEKKQTLTVHTALLFKEEFNVGSETFITSRMI